LLPHAVIGLIFANVCAPETGGHWAGSALIPKGVRKERLSTNRRACPGGDKSCRSLIPSERHTARLQARLEDEVRIIGTGKEIRVSSFFGQRNPGQFIFRTTNVGKK
jgi:hypothetical protein